MRENLKYLSTLKQNQKINCCNFKKTLIYLLQMKQSLPIFDAQLCQMDCFAAPHLQYTTEQAFRMWFEPLPCNFMIYISFSLSKKNDFGGHLLVNNTWHGKFNQYHGLFSGSAHGDQARYSFWSFTCTFHLESSRCNSERQKWMILFGAIDM